MEQRPIQITVPGIKKALRSYQLERAVCEYVWNGFDAGASIVKLDCEVNELGGIKELRITDNGSGINFDTLDRTFRPFFESDREFQQAAKRKLSTIHGKNGVGRLTFFRFARTAHWESVFSRNGESPLSFSISVDVDSLNTFRNTSPVPCDSPTGTAVRFTGINSITAFSFEHEILAYLKAQFAWFLELNGTRGFQILVNGDSLDYRSLVGGRDTKRWKISDEGKSYDFVVRYVQWLRRPAEEYSHYYYIGSNNVERHKETTTYNNKGDEFYHSVYITSLFFDPIGETEPPDTEFEPTQTSLFSKRNPIYRDLKRRVDLFLRDKRKPFLKRYTDILVERYERDGVFPEFKNPWELPRREELEQLVRDLYVVKPSLFSDLNLEQRKTLVRLLNLALDDSERNSLFAIIREVIDLDSSEREELVERFKYSKLSNINKTIKLIEDRFRAVEQLDKLVFDPSIYANERDHLQKMIERHYWLFGEQYSLVTADKGFTRALRNLIYEKTGVVEDVAINHADRKKRMDIFAIRQIKDSDKITCLVVELKHPNIDLGREQLNELEDYRDFVIKQPRFNGKNIHWKFFLVGKEYDGTGYIEQRIESAENYGERWLVENTQSNQIRTYVMLWSEVFAEFEIRHSFIQEKLQLERDNLSNNNSTADEIIAAQTDNTASGRPETQIPSKRRRQRNKGSAQTED